MRTENGGSFAQRNETCRFFPHGKVEQYIVNGEPTNADVVILPDTLYLMILDGGCFVCWYGQQPDFSAFNPAEWFILAPGAEQWYGPYELTSLTHVTREFPGESLVTFRGLGRDAFYLRDILDVAAYAEKYIEENPPPEQVVQQEERELRCPSCWLTFKPEETLSIAAHPDLLGDPILGEDDMLRFRPSAWDEASGFPLDACGSTCTEYACPHCLLKLPPFFYTTIQHILSGRCSRCGQDPLSDRAGAGTGKGISQGVRHAVPRC